MFTGISNLIVDLIQEIVSSINSIYLYIFNMKGVDTLELFTREINLSLFSENVIFSTNVSEVFIFTIITVFLVLIIKVLVKATKKFINMIFGVFKV